MTTDTAAQPNRLSRTTKLVYGSGELMNGTSTVIILVLYLKFLTDVVGLAPLLAGVCVMAGKLWDAISDPLVGLLSDGTRSRFGRRRVYFLVFALPASLAFVALFLPLDASADWVKVAYYATAYVVFMTLATLLNVPYQALGSELTSDYDERTSLIVFRMAFSIGGAIAAGVLPSLVVARFAAAGAPAAGHLVVAGAFGALYTVVWLAIFSEVPEPPVHERPPRSGFFQALGLTLRNRAFRILVGLYLAAFMALDVITAGVKFYIEEYIRRPGLLPVVMGAMLSAALLSLPFYLAIIRRWSRQGAYLLGAALWAAALAALFALPEGAPSAPIVIIVTLAGVGAGSAFVVPWSALPEVIDVDRVVTGRRQEGVFTGVMTFLRKLTTTLAIFLLSAALEWTGYRPNAGQAGQPDGTLLALRVLVTAAPAAILIVGIAFTLRYPVTKKLHGLLRKKLDREALSTDEDAELGRLLQRAYGPGAAAKR